MLYIEWKLWSMAFRRYPWIGRSCEFLKFELANEFQVACFCSKSERPTGNRSCQLPPLSSLPFLLFSLPLTSPKYGAKWCWSWDSAKKVTSGFMRILCKIRQRIQIHIRICIFDIVDQCMVHGPHLGEVHTHNSQWLLRTDWKGGVIVAVYGHVRSGWGGHLRSYVRAGILFGIDITLHISHVCVLRLTQLEHQHWL